MIVVSQSLCSYLSEECLLEFLPVSYVFLLFAIYVFIKPIQQHL